MAQKAFGTKLYRGGSGTPKTGGQEIETTQEITLPQALSEVVETTAHSSTKATFLNTYVDEGEIVAVGSYTAATGQELCRGDLGGAATGYYVNTAGGSGKKQLDFSALVTGFGLEPADLRGEIRYRATLKITGAVTWTNQS
jgi:hypothetical protein